VKSCRSGDRKMKKENSIILFNQKKVRRHWDDNKEQWYFSIVDVVAVLTDSSNPRRYWSDMKTKLKQEGSEVYEKIVQLKMTQAIKTIEKMANKKDSEIEKWSSLEDLQAHLSAPHMLAYKEKVKDLVDKVSLRVLGEA
jgi:quinol monooxygenase YgiN